ncbi:hypothetical protein ACFY00_25485 [Kitasatospora sp. NPDC001540]|uniref:hypothetical protein n=1 Tax=Kitasatospora sp. NPDC001540 TaxID=3364014 RepID=UPI00368AF694
MPLTRLRLLAVPLGAALALAAPWPSGAADTQPAVVPNATLSSPTVPAGQLWGGAADDWTGDTLLASAGRAGHPRQFQAVVLATATSAPIGTRVRGVRSGATTTLTWDDNPDSCVSSGGGRPYTVSVAGADNAPGTYTTKDANGQPNWSIGRSYSFTAAEDAPAVTFTFGTPSTDPTCRPMVTNVQALQTPPPPPTPAASGPCAGDGASSPACTTDAGNKEKLEKCPATSRDCLDSVAGKGEKENAGIDQQTQALGEFTNTPREQDPNAALGGLCQVANLHTENLEPGDTVLAPGSWWYC